MLFPLLPVPGSSHSKSLLRGSQSHCTHLYSPSALTVPGTDISTDSRIALDTKNQRVATGSSCKACFCDLSLTSVYMGRMECHGAYPPRYSWLKQLCKASLKTCLSHVFGRCSYLNYHLEILNSSLPRFSIKNKTATKQLGKHTWHVPCLTQSSDPILTLIPTHKQGTQGEVGQQKTSETPSKQYLYKGRGHRGDITEFKDEGLSLWYYKGKVSPPKHFSEESHHTCPWDQFLSHHTNLDGVILTCTNGRLEHNISK